VRGELRSVRASRERADGDLRRFRERAESLAARRDASADDAVRFRADCDEAGRAEEPLVAETERAEAERAEAAAALEIQQSLRSDAAEEASRWAARVEALQMALDAARARAGAERLEGVEGVLGTLLDLVEIDAGWEPAVEAALGESLTAVVVSDPEAGRRALAALRSSDTSGAVIALGTRPATVPAPQLGDPVRPHARSGRPGVSSLLDGLLGPAVRIDDVGAAVDAALSSPSAVVVTGGGDRFGLSGWRVGVAGSGATAAALDDAVHRAEEAAAELARATEAVVDAERRFRSAQAAELDVARRLDANDARFTAASEGLARAQRERREVEAELQNIERSIDDVVVNIDRDDRRIAELEGLLPALESDEQAEADAARAQDRRRADMESRAEALASRRKDLEVRRAGLDERDELLRRRLEETERRLAADAQARIEAEGQRVRIERDIAAIDRLAAMVEAHREVVEVLHADLAEQRRRQSDEVRGLATELDQLRRQRAEQERSLEVTRERARQAELGEAEARLRLESAIETVRRELDIEPAVAEAAEMPTLPEGATPAGRVRELERELRLLGPINPLALEEFNELQARHAFLEEQLEDVRSTRRDLSRVIAAVDAEIQSVFASAFHDVSENFTQLFGLLFPGGVGKLKLTAPDDLLNTGIEVEAKPSGKNVKKLSLLSGGERSLTALAYLFAVFRSRPSPFYVMDEVEAALDDVNLHRFLGLIHEFRKDAQLIVVSHQKRTMEAGDCLLGVSMQPGGSSKVVTERVSTASAPT
jgi:chromosome segregation protein